jgi:hypothetical protein
MIGGALGGAYVVVTGVAANAYGLTVHTENDWFGYAEKSGKCGRQSDFFHFRFFRQKKYSQSRRTLSDIRHRPDRKDIVSAQISDEAGLSLADICV